MGALCMYVHMSCHTDNTQHSHKYRQQLGSNSHSAQWLYPSVLPPAGTWGQISPRHPSQQTTHRQTALPLFFYFPHFFLHKFSSKSCEIPWCSFLASYSLSHIPHQPSHLVQKLNQHWVDFMPGPWGWGCSPAANLTEHSQAAPSSESLIWVPQQPLCSSAPMDSWRQMILGLARTEYHLESPTYCCLLCMQTNS